jgi:regulator of cell morphogenesis and NO signaling
MIPVLEAHVGKILAVHGERHPELHAIAQNVGTVTAELNDHMVKEERILFPYIRMLVDAEAAHRAPEPPPFGSIANPIAMMEREHLSAGDALFAVRRLSNGYVPPADGCTTYRVTLTELEEFELDLHRHVHLENNILFPRAIALETLLRPAETISRNA